MSDNIALTTFRITLPKEAGDVVFKVRNMHKVPDELLEMMATLKFRVATPREQWYTDKK